VFKKKNSDKDLGQATCFKCGEKIHANTLYCPKCERRQPIPMEGLERAYEDNMPRFVALLESELKEDPKNYYRHFLLGNALFITGDYKGAVHRYKMSLDLKPDFGDAKLNLGYVLRLTGDWNDAITMLEGFRREQPHSNKVESAQKMICELKGVPYEPRKPEKQQQPTEIIKPRSKRKPDALRRETLNIASLIFVCIILILMIFGFARKDIVLAAYDKSAGVVGKFLSSDVSSDDIALDDNGGDEADDKATPSGTDIIAGLFGRDENEVLEDDDWSTNPGETPIVPEKPEEETEEPGPGEPINLEPEYESYWPMKVGSSWDFDGYELDSRASLVEGSNQKGKIRVESLARSGETPVYEVNHLGHVSYFYENSGGVFKTNYPSRPFSTGVPNIIKPVTVGEKLSDPGIGTGYEVMEEIDIKVPAGLFRTIRIKTWIPDYPDQITEVFYGEGIGPVKIVTGSKKRGFRIWELDSYRID
jgi:hypothetical protein